MGGRQRTHIYKGYHGRRGNTTYPPEIEIWLDAFDIAIGDVMSESMEYYDVSNRAESHRWLLSKHFFWLGSIIWGVAHTTAFQNWVRDGMPPPEEARRRKRIYYTIREQF